MTIGPDNYLDIGNLLIYEFIGDPVLAALLAMIFVTYQSVKRKLAFETIVVLNYAVVALITSYVYQSLLWTLTLFGVGVLIYTMLPKMIKR